MSELHSKSHWDGRFIDRLTDAQFAAELERHRASLVQDAWDKFKVKAVWTIKEQADRPAGYMYIAGQDLGGGQVAQADSAPFREVIWEGRIQRMPWREFGELL